ncbi:MAG: LamG domain-containing protein [Candidatus Nanohaloarchaea archaeon]
MGKGVSPLISMVFYVAVIVSAIAIVMGVAMPTLERMQETAAIQGSMNTLQTIDQMVRSVASEGKYSTRTTTLRFGRGQYVFDNETGELYYRIDTTSNIVSTHTSVKRGPVLLSANADVSLNTTEINGIDCYMMTNQYLEACIRKIDQDFDPEPTMEAFWKLDRGSGQEVVDSSEHANNGTLGDSTASETSDPSWVGGIESTGLSFDGGDHVQVPGLATTSTTVSVTAWVKTSAAGDRTVVSIGDYVVLRGVVNGGSGEALYYDGTGYRSTSFSTNISDGTWHHLAYVVNSSSNEQRVYVDGSLEGSTSHAADVSYTGLGSDTYIGAETDGSNRWDGTIDDVRVYSRELTGEEVHWNFLQEGDVDYINTSELLVHYRNTVLGRDLDPEVSVELNNHTSTRYGTGYTDPERTGQSLGRGRVTATVRSNYGFDYQVHFDLLSGSDFLKVEADDTG